jgi:uncharacterized cupredoxin-like copper-binding protein
MVEETRHPVWAAGALAAAGVALALLLTTLGPSGDSRVMGTAAQAAVAAAPQSGAAAQAAAPQEQLLTVRLGDYFFEPDGFSVRAGQVRATITNAGERRHTFTVQDPTTGTDVFTTDRVNPGETVAAEFALPAAGTYRIYCTVSDHAERGQVASLTVAA